MRNRMYLAGWLAILSSLWIVVIAGCGGSTTDETNVSGETTVTVSPVTKDNAKSDNAKSNGQNATTTTPVEKEAKAGVGKKGKSYGGDMITEPASQYWKIQERLTFGNVKKAEDLYKATNGSLPKSHEDYMKDIIKANNLKLPDLDDGLEYHYDSEKQMLMVRSEQEE